jgi:protocatechuate 3,4-dioxygenase beta subunit
VSCRHRRGAPGPARSRDPAFFGGTATPSAASPVRLGLSQHAGAVDIQLIALKTGTVSGTVTGPDGASTMASVQLLDPLMPIAGLAVWFRHPGADGRFTFGGIVPGTYVLRAQRVQKIGSAGDGEFTATTTVHVPDGAEIDASVTLKRGITVSGTVQRGDLLADDLQKMQVTLYPILGPSDWEAPVPRATPDADGRFTISPVGPGPHRVRVDGLPRGWAVESAVFGGIDAADVDLEIRGEDIGDGRVTLASTTSELSGAVTDAKGEPARGRTVVVFPDDRQFRVPLSRRIHVVQTGADGRYVFRSLPAGDYRVTVADLSDPGQQFDRDFLAGIAPGAVAVTLEAGAARTENIRVR